MSEDEEYLVENIIKVFVTTKREAKKSVPKQIRKVKHPKILVTDHSSNDIKDIVALALKENKNGNYNSSVEEKPKEHLLKSGTEFESEPSDLMPDSFLSYLSSCKNLIGDISSYKEERLDADDWIGQFDQTITDAQNAAKEAEEFERLQLLKIEERRRKLEQRRLMRKINKPLINSVPKPLGSYNTYHDQVCQLPLEQLKKGLKRYQPVLDLRFSNVVNSNALEKELKSTCQVLTMLKSSFSAFLKIELRKKEKLAHLYVKGKCLISPKESKDGLEKNRSVKGEEMKEEKREILFLEDVLCIKCVVREEKLAKNLPKVKPKLRWAYDKREGILKNIEKRKSISKAKKDHGKQDLAKTKKRNYSKKQRENSLKKLIIAEQEKILKFMNKAKYLFNTYEQSKISTPKAKPKPKLVMTSLRVQVI